MSLPALPVVELVDGVPIMMVVVALFQNLSALTSRLRPAVVTLFVLVNTGALVNALGSAWVPASS